MSGQKRAGVVDITPNTSPGRGRHEASGFWLNESWAMVSSTLLQPCPGRYQSAAPPYQMPLMFANTHWLPSSRTLGSPKKSVDGQTPSIVWMMQSSPLLWLALVILDASGQLEMFGPCW